MDHVQLVWSDGTMADVPALWLRDNCPCSDCKVAAAPILRRRPDGSIGHIRYSNQLMQALDPSAPDIDRFYAAYHRLSELVLDPENQRRFRMEAGDLLVVHGHRVLHGRLAYEPSSGRRHLRGVYFELEDLVNHVFRLTEPLAEAG